MGKFVYDTAAAATSTQPDGAVDAPGAGRDGRASRSRSCMAPDGTVRSVEGASRIIDKITKTLPRDPAAGALAQGLKRA